MVAKKATQAEEDSLTKAQDATIAPQKYEADGNEGIGQILANQIETEDVEAQRQNDEKQ